MKKKLLITAALLAGVLVFAGCGNKEEAQEEETEESVEETQEEESTDDEVKEKEEAEQLEWTDENMEALTEVVNGAEDMEFVCGEASKDDIHQNVDYDDEVVDSILFSTSDVDFDTPGDYDVLYFVYFNREPLLDWMEENDIDISTFDGLEEAQTSHILVPIEKTVTIVEE